MAETYRMHPALKTKLAQVPNEPGCYLMRDRKGVLIYVGKAVSLRRRVLSYFRQATYRRGDPKLRGLLNSVADLEWIVVRNEAEALLMEGKLIKAYKPRYNISMRDDKRYLLLRVQPQDPFPVFEVCRVDRNDGALYFGPYVASRAARATLNYMERRWGLRRCKPVVPDTATHRHCLDDVVRYCSAPCVGKISSEAYHVQFDEACAFLRGERPAELEHIRKQMEEAAQSRDYEKAAVWRDLYALICEALEKRRKRALHPGNRVDHARQGVQALGSHLGMAVPPRVIEAFDISTISGTFSVASMVCCVEGSPARRLYRRFRIRSVAGMDDPRMMHEVLTRRYQRVLATGSAGPDLVVVDGGVTQWSAARQALDALGMQGTPLVALAKRFEEIYTSAGSAPLRLERSDSALHLLQRIRDEAHRFALTYHQALRSRRIRESALDEVTGMGPVRKQKLLSRFGSVSRLRRAPVQEIACIPGIGYKLAEEIHRVLKGPVKTG